MTIEEFKRVISEVVEIENDIKINSAVVVDSLSPAIEMLEQKCEEEIELMNEIIFKAIIHGGDAGGPYYSNKYNLYKAIENWLMFKKLTDKYMITEKEITDFDNGCSYSTIMKIVPIGEGKSIKFHSIKF